MSWVDIFYPGNPEKREKVIRLSQQLVDCMEGNFYATNELSDLFNTYMGTEFRHIAIKKESSIKDNCDILIERIHKIQTEIEKLDAKLKERLPPDIYYKLRDENVPLDDKLRASYKYVSGALSSAALLSGVFSYYLIGRTLSTVTSALQRIALSTLGAIVVGLLFVGVDMLISAILGAVERNQLEEAIAEYEKSLAEFKPASREYQKQIQRVMFLVEEKLGEMLKP